MAKTIKELIFDTRADLKRSIRMELGAAVLLAAGAILWYWATPMNIINVSKVVGQDKTVLLTNIFSVLIFALLGAAMALIVMDLLLHYLRRKQLDVIIYGMAAAQAEAEQPPPPPPPARPVQKRPPQRPQQASQQPPRRQVTQPQPRRDVPPQRRSIIQKKPPIR